MIAQGTEVCAAVAIRDILVGLAGLAFGSSAIRRTCQNQFSCVKTLAEHDLDRQTHTPSKFLKGATMARVCQVTGKGPITGNNVSHANNKTKRRFLPNLQSHRFWVESENRWVRLRVSANAMRTIDKNGIDSVLADLRARGEIA